MTNRKYISTTFSNFEKVNDEFVKCSISVMSDSQVANGTKFTRQAIDNALPTLNYAPIIGYYKDNDFSDHGIEYVISNGEFKEVIRTIPFGVCIKDSQRFEKIMKDNGEYEEYLVVDCYLWGRYSEAINKVKENKCNQSMEVSVSAGEWKESYYEVTEFNYSALCILSENVQSAFDLAKIRTSDKFSKDDFKANYSLMCESLDKFLNFEEGGEIVKGNKEVETTEEEFAKKKRKCSKCEQEIEFEGEFDENEEFICEECSKENYAKKTTVFELSFDDIREKLYTLIKSEDCYCWVIETFTDKFIYVKETWNDDTYEYKYYKQGYMISNEEVSLIGEAIEVFTKFLTQEEIDKLNEEKANYEKAIEEANDLKIKYIDLEGNYSVLNEEVVGLREFKSNIEKAEYKAKVDEELAKYSELNEIEGYSDIIKDKYTVDLDKLITDIKVFAFDNGVILGKKSNKKNFSKETTVKIPMSNFGSEERGLTEAEKRYGVSIRKYLNK